jgi:hypothetical protein
LAPTLPYSKQKFVKGKKLTFGLTFFFFLILCNENCCKYALKKQQNYSVCAIFCKLSMLNITFRAGAGAASRYGSGFGSAKMMWLLAAPAPQHWFLLLKKDLVFKVFLLNKMMMSHCARKIVSRSATAMIHPLYNRFSKRTFRLLKKIIPSRKIRLLCHKMRSEQHIQEHS